MNISIVNIIKLRMVLLKDLKLKYTHFKMFEKYEI